MTLDVEAMKSWIAKGAQPTNRVAKLAYNHSKDEFFKAYIIFSDSKKEKKDTK